MHVVGIEELEAQLQASGPDPRSRVDALNALAFVLRNSDPNRAKTLASEARKLSIEHGYTLGQARAARVLAMAVVSNEDIPMVYEMALEAREKFDAAGDPEGQAGSRDFLASLHEHVGDLGTGLNLALDALSIARRIGHRTRQGYALSSVGGILAASGETDAAIERLMEARTLFEADENLDGLGTIFSRLSSVLRKAGRSDEALDYARRCLELGNRTGPDYLTFSALQVMGDVAAERDELEEAESLYRKALDTLEGAGRNVLGPEIQIALSRVLMRKGAWEEAEAELKDSLRRAQAEEISILAHAATHEALADLYEARGWYEESTRHLRQLLELRSRVARQEARAKTAQVEARAAMEAAKKDAEIHKLRFVELRDMQSKLLEADKMALLGKLAAGTAHELNSPLGVLRSNAELTYHAVGRLWARIGDADSDETARIREALATCRRASTQALDRIGSIAESFKRFTQLDQSEFRSYDVREGLESALALLEPTVPPGVSLRHDFQEVPQVPAWPRELNYAFMTVLQNAVQAIEGTGVVTAETERVDDQVHVRIRDTGRGMSEAQVAHLFDVDLAEDGKRTKMRLGLSAAYATVQKHGGHIDVESQPGKGTTVTFRFPIPAT